MLKNNKTFTKFIRTCTLLHILMFYFSVCLLLAPGYAHATDFVTGSYSAGDYTDSSYNQGSDDSSDNDNSNDSTDSSDESITTVTNPDTGITTTNTIEDQIEDQKPLIDKSSTIVGVIIAIGVAVLAFIIAMLLWVKKHKAK